MLKKIALAMLVCLWGGAEETDLGALEIIKDIEKTNLGAVENYGYDLNYNKTTEAITSQELQDFNASDVANSLKYATSVFYAPQSGQRGEPSFYIRGFSNQNIGIFIDGIPVSSIYDAQTDWSQFGIFDAELIQISKGYVSSLYGASAMGGAINIVTKKPKKELEVDFRAQLSPANMQHGEYLSVGSNLGKVYMSASVSNINRSYYYLSDSFTPTDYQPGYERLNSYYSSTKVALKLGIVPNDSDEYVFNASYSRGKKGGTPNTQESDAFWDWPHYDKWGLSYIGRTALGNSFMLHTKAWVDGFYNDLRVRGQWSGITQGITQGSNFQTQASYSIYDDYTLGAYLGLDWILSEQDLLKFVYTLEQDNHDNTNTDPTSDTIINDMTHYLTAEYTHEFNKQWRLGLTGSFVDNHILNMNIGGQRDTTNKTNVWGLSGQAIVYYDPLEYLGFYATVGKKDRLPTMKDKYSSKWGIYVPNPNLQTESSLNAEIGGNYNPIEDLKLSLAVYYNSYLNAMDSRNVGDGSCAVGSGCKQVYNIRGFNAYAVGAEVGLEYTFSDKFLLSTNYSYIYKRQKANDDNNGDTRFSGIPDHLWNVQMVIKPTSGIDIIAGTRLLSKIYQGTDKSGVNLGFTPMVFLADLKLVTRPIENLELGVGVDNLFDRNYYYDYGYNMEGRRVYVELALKY